MKSSSSVTTLCPHFSQVKLELRIKLRLCVVPGTQWLTHCGYHQKLFEGGLRRKETAFSRLRGDDLAH
jgi:hypothetical protein